MINDVVEELYEMAHGVVVSPRICATAASEIVRLREILGMGIDMRVRQKAYFKSRSKDALVASKQAEAAFDRAVKEEWRR